jgi:hypothetical protein
LASTLTSWLSASTKSIRVICLRCGGVESLITARYSPSKATSDINYHTPESGNAILTTFRTEAARPTVVAA